MTKRLGIGLGILLVLCVAACGPRQPVQPQVQAGPGVVLQEATQALNQGDTQRAQRIFSGLVGQENLNRGQLSQAWTGLYQAAWANGHLQAAEQALRSLARFKPEVTKTWRWQSRLLRVLDRQDRQRWLSHVDGLLQNASLPWSVRVQTVTYLCSSSLSSGHPAQAWPRVQDLSARADSRQKLRHLERSFLEMLRSLSPKAWLQVKKHPPEPETFPVALTNWAMTMHSLEQESIPWAKAWRRLQAILDGADLALADELRTTVRSLQDRYGLAPCTVTLLLPLKGAYAPMGWKVASGASVAQWQLSLHGQDFSVQVINTTAPDWFKEVQNLPPGGMIGGPLRQQIWKALLQTDLVPRHTFFAFRPKVAPGEEGVDGFRFFPGPKDQIRPLLELMADELQVENYALMYPQGEYGRRMSSVFWEEIQASSGRVTGMSGYDPQKPETWRKSVADLLRVRSRKTAEGGRVPPPDFKAVFIPDGFAQAQMLIPEFFYFDQDHLLFLGPTLWSQGVHDISELDRKYYQLAVMTTPWVPGASARAAQRLRQGLVDMNEGSPDFWKALGYDFVRLAQAVHTRMSDMNQEVGQVLANMQDFSWSMAPLSWDGQGRARQELIIVQPRVGKAKPLDMNRFKARWKAKQRRLQTRRTASSEAESDGQDIQAGGHLSDGQASVLLDDQE